MNTTEELTAVRLVDLARTATPASTACPDLAVRVLARAAQPPRRRRRVKTAAAAVGLLATGGLVAAAALRGGSDYRQWTQPSGAMRPAVGIDQTVLIGKRLAPKRGDVVMLRRDNGFETLSRVIGLPGDTVSCPARPDGTCDAVVVSGRTLHEPWLTSRTDPFPAVAVPAGQIFVLGDARDQAADSRVYGPQPIDAVRGVVIARFLDGHKQPVPGVPLRDLHAPTGIDPADSVPPAPAVPG